MIKVLIGDLFSSKMEVLVNTINCVGVMGKGIAKKFKELYPENYHEYKELCAQGNIRLGKPYYYEENEIFRTKGILNFPTKKHWRNPSHIDDIIEGLDYFRKHYKEWNIKSIAFPPLGCGNGGLEWSIVGRVMYQKLCDLDIEVEIYAPYGTSAKQLSEEFLNKPIQMKAVELFNHFAKKIKPGWVVILEVVDRLANSAYTDKVGRVYFQKICYVVTELGVDTGFKFEQKPYGPFSEDVKEAIKILSNSNIITEQQSGKKTVLMIEDDYKKLRNKYKNEIDKYIKVIDKTVDLFRRIKKTEQAEEATTVFYSARKLKENKSAITESELLDYILKWKKYWDTKEKKESIISTIRNLVILKWLDVEYSENLPENGGV